MKNRYLLLSILLVLAVAGATLALYGALPDRMPVHWNIRGEVDRYGARANAWLMPGIMAGSLLLFAVLPKISPARFSVDAFTDTYWYCALLVVAMLAWAQAVMLWGVTTGSGATTHHMLAGVAVFIALLGNVMGKVRSNFWIGVRTPWTLANERVWYATHRLAAKTMVGFGALSFVAALADQPAVALALLLAGPLVPAAYSLVYYKRLEREGGLHA
ncbi:SdpI family protein [Massilia agilis]|uniref:SdpI family protein n=1 Tax=Massilia agilis TaxID=1811226 RepID=A0ABT2D912_9BURK|nr:SdpI family protein [Massilia agilis]MCS0806916.1 SdpI family protein [Massilia agilis]